MRKYALNNVQETIRGLRFCPACESKNLIRVEGDAFCGSCSWNSTPMSVDSGELDDLIYAYEVQQEENQRRRESTLSPLPRQNHLPQTA